MTSQPERIAVVGFGPVAARLVDELVPAVREGRVQLTVIGAEASAAYNRVLVADVGVGRTTAEAISLADAAELRGQGVSVRLGRKVQRIDRARRQLLLDDGSLEPYDRLVLATGARPVVPTLTGLNPDPAALHLLPPGVTALRDLGDASRLHQVVAAGGRVIVLGGGILGIEAALAAAEEGASVTVVHHGLRPLGRNIDTGGGAVLALALRARGITLVSNARSTGLRFRNQPGGRHRFDALVLEDGTEVPADLLLLSCGVRPRTALAEGCGLAIGTGILVNHGLAADAEGRIFAIGDCAQVNCGKAVCTECRPGSGAPLGLIAPGWRQAEFLARRLLAATAAGGVPDGSGPVVPDAFQPERPPVILLKARGVDLAAAGNVNAELWDDDEASQGTDAPSRRVSQWADPEHGRYAKMVTRAGVLEGLVCVGMPRTAAELVLLFERGAELPADRTALFRLDALEALSEGGGPVDPDSALCRCTGATVGSVEQAVAGGCSTVQEVSACTRAGSGCGSCKSRIQQLIDSHHGLEPAPAG
ncbi:nitrite reductase [Arthrobacter crystallopoietes BAB-32]|uniref:Nitrite reductase n=1 Tax=Arthrobacter crystallopoietes BAB-32 TaxID=1246476 RepID=N1UQF7_9MICC|nr:FAD-dependent oxidoreductase [Arthrobacter crystallopoietes]EMY32621.1 nitrite reductase [Arthrobacter crystallopoietes BAB-32]